MGDEQRAKARQPTSTAVVARERLAVRTFLSIVLWLGATLEPYLPSLLGLYLPPLRIHGACCRWLPMHSCLRHALSWPCLPRLCLAADWHCMLFFFDTVRTGYSALVYSAAGGEGRALHSHSAIADSCLLQFMLACCTVAHPEFFVRVLWPFLRYIARRLKQPSAC